VINFLNKYCFVTAIYIALQGLPILALAQNPVHRVLDNVTGLPSNSVYNILQDGNGFIWLSHDKGLSRYDGKQLVQYKIASLQSKSVSNLMQIQNSIWCQDFTGSFYYTTNYSSLENSQFYTPGAFSVAGFTNNTFIISVKYDSIRQLNLQTKQYTATAIENLNHSGVFYTTQAAYFIKNNYLTSYNGNTYTSVFKIPTTKNNFSFLLQSNNQFYGITKNTYPYIHSLQNDHVTALPHLPKGLFIQDINLVQNEIWVSTSTGAYCFTKNFEPKYNGRCFFNNQSISKVIKDREGNYWFGTLNKGVLIVPNIQATLHEYNGNGFTAMALANNNILLGTTANSIVSFNTSNNQFSPVFAQPNNHEVVNILYNPFQQQTIFSSNTITFLQNNQAISNITLAGKSAAVIKPNLYAIAYASGLCLANPTKQILPAEIPSWLQTNNGIYDGKLYKLNINSGRCRYVFFDSCNNTLYAATANGLFYFAPYGKGQILYNSKAIYASQIVAMNGKVYVASFKQGVFAIKANKLLEQLPVYNNAIYKIYASNNNLWLITDDGLLQYNLAKKTTTNFTSADGLPKAELKDVLVNNNTVHVATSVGLVSLNAQQNSINTVAPLLQLNNITVNGLPYTLSNLSNLASDSNNIAIHFSALSFKSTDAVRVQYKINNAEWQTLELNSRTIALPSLSAGKYIVEITAINEDGITAKKPLQISFYINAPFFKQWWFIVAIMFAACLLVYIYFKRRLQNQHRQNVLLSQKIMLEQELQQSMLASIKSQMNPHFLFNALNTIQSYIYTNEKENASEYLGKFSELTRLILDMSNKTAVSVATEIKALQLYLALEKQRFEEKLNYTFVVDDAINTETSFIPSMLIQPYVENAIKHGLLHSKNNWQLNVHFEKQPHAIQVIIDDNGIGRKRSIELNRQRSIKHQSFATIANKKRLDILNKGTTTQIAVHIDDKIDDLQQPIGTTVTLNIPFQQHV
jgi:sensor histidine kinase YesM